MFTWLPKPLYNLYRRYFGTYLLDDPRPIKQEAPYTFYLPSKASQDSVMAGDTVQLVFVGDPPGLKFGAERMWVEVDVVEPEGVVGKLDNMPSDMPQLKPGDTVRFQPFHIISFFTDKVLPDEAPQRQYWDRCMVDRCVIDAKVPVYYIYREEPDIGEEGDRYPDSGWRLRGDYRDITDEALAERDTLYIALGSVLNADDSWLHLIDFPIGSAFLRNFETGKYEPYDQVATEDE